VAVTWHELTPDDLPAVSALAGRCLATDGGLPLLTDLGFLRARFTAGETLAASDGANLVAAAATRPALDRALGLVDPGWRGRGLGSRLLDWSLARARVVETEGLTDGAAALFGSRGLACGFAEDVMAFDLAATPLPEIGPPAVTPWDPALADRFFATYEASFRDRPGFPGWSKEDWVEDFDPRWTLLASTVDGDVGFITGEDGWIVQVGVVPAARGSGLGAALVTEALRRMRAHGLRAAGLTVNANNPHAAALYRRLGFTVTGRRATFTAAHPPGTAPAP